MARVARIVLPDLPHHVLQHGVRSMALFAADADRQTYLQLLAEFTAKHHVQVWAWCLMTNHIHLVLVPAKAPALARAVGETHRKSGTATAWGWHLDVQQCIKNRLGNSGDIIRNS